MPEGIYRNPPWHIDQIIERQDAGQVIDWGLQLYGVSEAWKVTRGKGCIVAVLDTGVQADHPDLADQLAGQSVDGTGSPYGASDRQGHGTHCAGIVAAADNGIGTVGVAPEAKLLCGKVLGDDGSGASRVIADGIDWAVRSGAHVISLSLGSPEPDQRITGSIARALAAGRFVICAAGNSGPNNRSIDNPGRDRNAVAVAAIRRDGTLSDFSSRGPEVAFAAPGEKILSLFPNSRLATLSGTSMATPFLAGVVALCVAKHLAEGDAVKTPLRTRDELVEHLKRYAVDIGTPGFDPGSGFGVIDVSKLAEGHAPPNPEPLPTPPPAELGVTLFIPGAKVVQGGP